MKLGHLRLCLACDEVWSSKRTRCPVCERPEWIALSRLAPPAEHVLPDEVDRLLYGDRPVAAVAEPTGLAARVITWPAVLVMVVTFLVMALAVYRLGQVAVRSIAAFVGAP